jgi:hypothetical protein
MLLKNEPLLNASPYTVDVARAGPLDITVEELLGEIFSTRPRDLIIEHRHCRNVTSRRVRYLRGVCQ